MLKKILNLLVCFYLSSFAFCQTVPYLNLTTNGYVDINNYSKVTSLSNGTISFWANCTSSSNENFLFSASNKGIVNVNNNELYISRRQDGRVLVATVLSGSLSTAAFTPVGSFPSNSWHNITAVFNGTGPVEIYIDGVVQVLTAGSGGSINEKFFNNLSGINNMRIGLLERSSSSFYYSNGVSIDNFSIWDIAFTSSEVTQGIANPDSYKICDRKLYYDFNTLENLSLGAPGVNDIKDKTMNGLDGDVVNGSITSPVSVPDVELALSNTSYVDVLNYSAISSLDHGTISFWTKIQDLNASSMLFSASNSGTMNVNNNEFYITYRSNKYIEVAGIVNGVTLLDAYSPVNAINDNGWHNISVVADGLGDIQLYIDGNLQTLTAGTCCGGDLRDFFFSDVTGINSIRLGSLNRASGTIIGPGLTEMDDFRIWYTALSAADIAKNITGESYLQTCGLVTYYNFNELADLGIGASGANDYKDITLNTIHGDYHTNQTTGVMVQNNSNFNIINNISSQLLTIEFKNSTSDQLEIVVADLSGRIVMQKSESKKGNSYQLNISTLKEGLYVLSVQNDNSLGVFRFVRSGN